MKNNDSNISNNNQSERETETNEIDSVILENGEINIHILNSTLRQESKIATPSGERKEWTFEQVLAYFGKDVRLPYVPEGLNENFEKQRFGIYEDKNEKVTFDNVKLTYKGKISNNDCTLDVLISKGKLPVVDEVYGQKDSYIGKTQMRVYFSENAGYIAQFIFDNIGYRIYFDGTDKTEFVKILSSIVN